MGVRTDGFEEAIMELMSAMEVNVEDDLEVLLQINCSETRGHCELKNLITNVNYEVGSSKRRTNNSGRVRSEL